MRAGTRGDQSRVVSLAIHGSMKERGKGRKSEREVEIVDLMEFICPSGKHGRLFVLKTSDSALSMLKTYLSKREEMLKSYFGKTCVYTT